MKRITTLLTVVAMLLSLAAVAGASAWVNRDSGNATETLVYNPSIFDCPAGETVWIRTRSAGFGPADSTGSVTFSWQSALGNGSATFSDDFDLEPSGSYHIEQKDTLKNNITYAEANPAGLSSIGDMLFDTRCF